MHLRTAVGDGLTCHSTPKGQRGDKNIRERSYICDKWVKIYKKRESC